ncbi:MAG: 3,4-dihydroxy-2-butanone 4-phosphate synthase [Rhodobacteraceae bacterium]|nr:3,4-dihydroxy-2-butanone 4-phosphate synthase [Paracoccaceae bacterium]
MMHSAPTPDPQSAADPQVIAAARSVAEGRPVLLLQAESGVLTMAGRAVTPEWVNFLATEGRGLVGIAVTARRAAELGLTLQPRKGRPDAPLYTQSIEARDGISTGISAADRARTILAAEHGTADDIVTPGHVFPQIADEDDAAGAALLLLRLGDAGRVAVLGTILDAAGHTADRATAMALAEAHGLAVLDLAATAAEHRA